MIINQASTIAANIALIGECYYVVTSYECLGMVVLDTSLRVNACVVCARAHMCAYTHAYYMFATCLQHKNATIKIKL